MSYKKIPTFKIMLHPFKDKVLKNGKVPVVVRATYQRNRKYFYLGLSALPGHWNCDLSLFQRTGKRLTEEEKESNTQLQKHLLALKENEVYFNDTDFTFSKFNERFFGAY